MAKQIQREPEMQELKRELPFTSTPKNEANEGMSASIDDPDTMLTTIVLLLVCLALAVLAHAVI
jgi:hypothetical protein